MQLEKANPAAPHSAHGVRKIDQHDGAIFNQNSLEALRAQYFSEVFALPSDTAAVLAELAFGGAA